MIHPLSTSISTRLMAPDADVSTMAAGNVTVDVVPPAGSAPAATEINLAEQPAVEASSAVKAVETKTQGPSDFGMESPEESAERAGLIQRPRGPDGKFLPKEPKSSSPSSKPATVPAKPAPKPSVVTSPAMEAKVKIGGEEKTAAEWEAHFKDLSAKAAVKPTEPVAKDPEPAPTKTEEQTAAEQAERETNFLTRASEGYAISEHELDEIIAGGPDATKKLATLLAKVEMKSRQFAAAEITKIAEHYDSLTKPLLERDQLLQTHLQDAAFLGAHADIKSHPQGLATYQQIKRDMASGYDAIQAKIAANTATKAERGWALLYEDKSPEDLQSDIAEHTRAALAKLPSPNAAPAAQPTKPVPADPAEPAKPKVPVERPLNADRPGAGGAPRGQTEEQRLAAEVNAQMGHRV